VGGQEVKGRITSLRKVDWGSMRVNFFVIFPRSEMPELPQTQIAAFRTPRSLPPSWSPTRPSERGEEVGASRPRSAAAELDDALSHDFPNVTNVDVTASIAQVQGVLSQVVRAVEFLFGFTLAAGLVVLFAAMSTSREARIHEFAVMRALGAGARLLGQVQRAELIGLGALAGILAAVCAGLVAWALAFWVFDFTWKPSVWLLPAGALVGAVLAGVAGWWGLKEVLRQPVVQTLRMAARE
jgi:putative ABC transport system permease protein